MNRYLLDTSALLTLRDDEPGADEVARLLREAQEGKAVCFGCFMTQMELLYRVWKTEGELNARLAYEQSLSLPINWVHEDKQLLEKAAEIKATHSLSVADAWIAACASLKGAVLVHKDPEFEGFDHPQIVLPLKDK